MGQGSVDAQNIRSEPQNRAGRSQLLEMDRRVRQCLDSWPQRPPGLEPSVKQPGTWLKARPDPCPEAKPYIKVPGSDRLRTIPDGLYLHFSPRPDDLYVDILCIEACSTYQNLLDKRARFAPSTGSLIVVCPLAWLQAPVSEACPLPRWRLLPCIAAEPRQDLTFPVRDARVLFALSPKHYEGFVQSQTAQAHEFFFPMTVLTEGPGADHPGLRALISRASAASNFMDLPSLPL